MKKVLVPIADGTEEIEAVTIIDVLRRANFEVTVASVTGSMTVTCSRGVKITADIYISELQFQSFDMVALPGGMPGAEYLRHSKPLKEMLDQVLNKQGWVAAICASPAIVLAPLGYLKNREATCYPSFSEKIERYTDNAVVVDEGIVTSQGPATAMEFALKLVELLASKEVADEVASGLLFPSH